MDFITYCSHSQWLAHLLGMLTNSFDIIMVGVRAWGEEGGELAFYGGACWCQSVSQIALHYGLGVANDPEHLS